jgi:hypothetical protein
MITLPQAALLADRGYRTVWSVVKRHPELFPLQRLGRDWLVLLDEVEFLQRYLTLPGRGHYIRKQRNTK